MLKINIVSLFPEMFQSPFSHSIVKTAQERKIVQIKIHQLRHWAIDDYGTIDDRPYGGGIGMILRCEPVFSCIEEIKEKNSRSKTVLLTPQGKSFTQKTARKLSKLDQLILLCGHYEGVDERIRTHLIDEEISLGDFVLTGGEIPAMAITDSIVRLLPGVLEKEAHQKDSFSLQYKYQNKKVPLLEYPQYTRPALFRGWQVPSILLSGNHQEIEIWREKESLKRTKRRRPEFFSNG